MAGGDEVAVAGVALRIPRLLDGAQIRTTVATEAAVGVDMAVGGVLVVVEVVAGAVGIVITRRRTLSLSPTCEGISARYVGGSVCSSGALDESFVVISPYASRVGGIGCG